VNREMTAAERELAACYDMLAALLRERPDELAPFAERNARKALAALWQVVNGLDLAPSREEEGPA
jgi:hypothetical protein